MVEEIQQLKLEKKALEMKIHKLNLRIEKLQKRNYFLKKELDNGKDRWTQERIAYEETLSLMDDIEDLKIKLKAVQNGKIE